MSLILTICLPLVSLEKVPAGARSAYLQSYSSIFSVRYDFETEWTRNETSNPTAVRAQVGKSARDDRRRRLEVRTDCGSVQTETISTFDSEERVANFLLKSSKDDVASAQFANVSRDRSPSLGAEFTIQRMMGGEFGGGEMGLAALLNGSAQSVSWEQVDDHRCLRIDFGPHPRYSSTSNQLSSTVVWLDPEFGYLPRRRRTVSLGAELLPKEESTGINDFFDVRVTKFQPIRDAALGGDVVLPTACVVETVSTTFEVRLRNLVINSDIDASTFSVRFPFGTKVTDLISKETHYVGDEAGRDHYLRLQGFDVSELKNRAKARRDVEVPSMPEAVNLAVSARPDQNLSAWYWWVILGGVFCLVGAYAVRRATRQANH